MIYLKEKLLMKPLETNFERIETKYLVSKTDLHDLIEDLKDYLVEDDYPTSTISNIYFDTEDFQLIQDSLQDQHKKEKIRMRTYLAQPSADSPFFLEIKFKDDSGIGHKHRVLSQSYPSPIPSPNSSPRVGEKTWSKIAFW